MILLPENEHLIDKLWFRLFIVVCTFCFIGWAVWMRFICECTIE